MKIKTLILTGAFILASIYVRDYIVCWQQQNEDFSCHLSPAKDYIEFFRMRNSRLPKIKEFRKWNNVKFYDEYIDFSIEGPDCLSSSDCTKRNYLLSVATKKGYMYYSSRDDKIYYSKEDVNQSYHSVIKNLLDDNIKTI